MTGNEILREMLTERGVVWEAFDDFEQTTQWSTHNGAFVYWARERDGKLLVETTAPAKCSASCTPEQAIEATLGCGTCYLISAPQYGEGCQECSSCGAVLDGCLFDGGRCPNCGAKVIERC